MKYYSGRTNLAATIFVPFACGNNCSFCNTNTYEASFREWCFFIYIMFEYLQKFSIFIFVLT